MRSTQLSTLFIKRAIAFLGVFTLISSSTQPAQAAETRIVDIAQITWNGASQPEVTSSDVSEAIRTKVNASWKLFTTFQGDVQDRSLDFITGRILENPIRLTVPMNCAGNNFNSFTNALRSEVYSKLGIADSKSRLLVVLTPAAGCIWSGRATVGSYTNSGGVVILHNTASAFVITHEIGHTLGLGHSNLLRCDSSAKDGAWSRSCKAVEYGGSIDVMGNVETNSTLSTYHQWRLGLLDATEVKQSWLNESVELLASDVRGGQRAIFIRDGSSTYWIEYRRPNANNSYKPGLVVFRTDPPPSSFIESPSPEDQSAIGGGLGVSTDMWMLNLDTYNYSSTGRATGSMTLPTGGRFTFQSGNVTLETSATNSEDRILLKITRRSDTTPPPIPSLTSASTWSSPDSRIVEEGYDDRESVIANFELKINDVMDSGKFGSRADFVPTYLDPLVSRRSLFVKDLPEGSYNLAVRAVDIWGNTSEWSKSQKVLVDRSRPNTGNSLVVTDFSDNRVSVSMSDFSDAGSGLCKTSIYNDEGFVLQTKQDKKAPVFEISRNSLSANFEIFDCLGNGLSGKLRFTSSLKSPQDVTRSGKWQSVSAGGLTGLKCAGKCTMSFTIRDNLAIISGEGSADVSISGKVVAKIANNSRISPRVSYNLAIGAQSKLVRISGRDFAVFGLLSTKVELSKIQPISRSAPATDLSLTDAIQLRMSKFGFNTNDFVNGWTVIPMDRGTTTQDPTLDLCSASYVSESGRIYRRQTVALKSDSPYLFLSSEVVKYRNAEAGLAALKELQTNFEACVKNKGGVESGGAFVDYSFSSLPSSNAKLAGENSRVIVRAQIGKGSASRQLLAFYQFNGEIFTGLYIVRAGETGFADSEVINWFDVAGVLAQRLDAKF